MLTRAFLRCAQMFEGAFAPPFYTDLYNFRDGAQDDIFEDSYPDGIPEPSPEQTVVPTPVLSPAAATPTGQSSGSRAAPQPSGRARKRSTNVKRGDLGHGRAPKPRIETKGLR